jgi:hypothetical protein
MATTNNFEIPKNSYVAFDATSLRQLIVDRLNEQRVFTDQNFVGSNLASIIDIIAYSYHTLIYYLNKTSSESMFTEAQLYENINRVVKLIDYAPVGFQTSTLAFTCSAVNLQQGLYTIPRYTYAVANNIPYSFNEDVTFTKTTDITIEQLTELAAQKLLFQGIYQEYPIYTASGEANETLILNTKNDLVDHFNIDVFVKPVATGKWEMYSKTINLFLEPGTAKKYEIRLNPNKRYEIKFGNNINGTQLSVGDQVAVYYMTSLGVNGEVGPNAFNSAQFIGFNTIQYNQILADVFANQYRYLTVRELQNITLKNDAPSTPIKEAETADEIRQSAPSLYRSQYRLVTTRDYETFIKSNFGNFVADVRAITNEEYIAGYLKYFYDIGVAEPSKTERALFNQVMYADACNFNNVYLLTVPRTAYTGLDYLMPSQKEAIKTLLAPNKMATTETTFVDPIYKAINFGVISSSVIDDSFIDDNMYELQVYKKISSRRSDQSIINDVVNVFNNYFSRDNIKIGQILDIRLLTQNILNIEGIETIYTASREDSTIKTEGLSFFFWNPVYPFNDRTLTTSNISLKYFEYPYYYNLQKLSDKIKVVTTN